MRRAEFWSCSNIYYETPDILAFSGYNRIMKPNP